MSGVRLVISGPACTGKTTIRNCLGNDGRPSEKSAQTTTVAAEHTKISMASPDSRSEPVKLTVIDTAGQELFNAMVPAFYRKGHIKLFVISPDRADNYDRFLEYPTTGLDIQEGEIEDRDSPATKDFYKVFIVLNKVDVFQKDNPEHASLRKKLESLAKQLGAEFVCTCAVKGDKYNIDTVLMPALRRATFSIHHAMAVSECKRSSAFSVTNADLKANSGSCAC